MLSSVQMYPHINWAIPAVFSFFFFFFVARMRRSVSGPSDSLCPQAVINYRHVSSAQTPPPLPPLCDTGHMIILATNKKCLCNLVLEEFLSCLLSAASIRNLSVAETWMHKIITEIHTCDVFSWEDENMWRFTRSWVTPQILLKVFVF